MPFYQFIQSLPFGVQILFRIKMKFCVQKNDLQNLLNQHAMSYIFGYGMLCCLTSLNIHRIFIHIKFKLFIDSHIKRTMIWFKIYNKSSFYKLFLSTQKSTDYTK